MDSENTRLEALNIFCRTNGHLPLSVHDWTQVVRMETWIRRGTVPEVEPPMPTIGGSQAPSGVAGRPS